MSHAPCGQLAGLLLDWFAARLQDNAEKPDQVQDEKAGGLGRLLFFCWAGCLLFFWAACALPNTNEGAARGDPTFRAVKAARSLKDTPPTNPSHPSNQRGQHR